MENKLAEGLKAIRPDIDFFSVKGLISEEILDSFDVICILAFLSEEFNVDIDPDDVTEAYFDDLDKIVNLLTKYQCES